MGQAHPIDTCPVRVLPLRADSAYNSDGIASRDRSLGLHQPGLDSFQLDIPDRKRIDMDGGQPIIEIIAGLFSSVTSPHVRDSVMPR